ncbi:hypothetical protein G6F32_014258 [Rhizopus arrhizus]|nr:hypothetical protein G6F32_014258 [Rhizopus arrhizus]
MSGRHMMHGLALGLMLALPSLSFAAAEPNTQVPAGSRHYAATTVPDRIVASPSADPSHAFAVAWRTDGSVQAPLRTGLEADAGHRGGRLVATAAAVVRVAAGDVAIVRFEAHAAACANWSTFCTTSIWSRRSCPRTPSVLPMKFS